MGEGLDQVSVRQIFTIVKYLIFFLSFFSIISYKLRKVKYLTKFFAVSPRLRIQYFFYYLYRRRGSKKSTTFFLLPHTGSKKDYTLNAIKIFVMDCPKNHPKNKQMIYYIICYELGVFLKLGQMLPIKNTPKNQQMKKYQMVVFRGNFL